MYRISLPTKRSFSWRALWVLVILWFLANLAGIPLLRATNAPIEPAWLWGGYTVVMAAFIGIGLYLSSRTGLGAPLIEGLLDKHEIRTWARSALAWALLAGIAGSLIVLPMSWNADAEHYPASWQLILASIKAGVTEEIVMRVLLMSLFVWLGSLISRDSDGRPSRRVFWATIVVCAVLFGGSHVGSRLAIPGITAADLVILMLVNTFFGTILGWLFWKLGLECAMLAHFMIDATASAVVVPAYLSGSLWLQIGAATGLMLAGAWSVRVLARAGTKMRRGDDSITRDRSIP